MHPSLRLFFVLFVFSTVSAACESSPAESAGATPPATKAAVAPVKDVDASALKAILSDGKHQVVDVRTPEEFAAGHIKGAININVNAPDFAARAAALPPNQPLVVHCAAGTPGGRSRRAVETLKKTARADLIHLNGGFNAWSQAGFTVEK